jgi:hypothetical protein
LQRYREFLAVQPRGPQADTVKLLVRQLEAELAPAPAVAMHNVTKTNSLPATNIRSVAIAATNPSPQMVVVKSNAPAAIAKTNQTVAVVTNKPAAPVIIPVTVVAVTNEAPVKIATAPAPAPRPPTAVLSPAPLPPAAIRETTPEISSPLVSNPSEEEKKKPGLFARLNPFGGKTKSTNETPRSVVLNPTADTLPDAERARALEPKEAIARYHYLSPVPPAKGSRFNAERALQRALEAQRAGRKSEAQLQFENALSADASYFDAQYNAALFAFQAGDLQRALVGWETALALEPDSINARYSFALTLKQANYPRDSAAELEKIIEGKPEDARAHLALGNLYAQSLNEPAKARAHYQKVLTLDPRSPQASAIRFWLAANP